jgi:hypothetical protein
VAESFVKEISGLISQIEHLALQLGLLILLLIGVAEVVQKHLRAFNNHGGRRQPRCRRRHRRGS